MDNGNYFVDGNGNHRIILFKLMMLAEIIDTYPYASDDIYDWSLTTLFSNIRKKYWLNAKVRLK